MIFRGQIGWLVAWAYIITGVRHRIVRRIWREHLIVPVLMHGPTPAQLEAILRSLDQIVGLDYVELTFDDGRKVLKDCIPVLEKFNKKAVFFISPGEILQGYNAAEVAKGHACPTLSVVDIQRLARHPLIEFGNHTWSHMSCATHSVAETIDEIKRTQDQIEVWTGYRPMKFSYPFGHDSKEVDVVVRKMGLVSYCLRPGLVTDETRGVARNMAYEKLSVAENVGRLLTAWPKVKRMPV